MQTIEIDRLDLREGQKVLDLGCGEGRHLHAAYFSAKITAIGLDLSYDDVVSTREGFESYPDLTDTHPRYGLTVGDALHLPFADASFDVVICSEVLEHLPDYHGALKEIARVLRADGQLAVSVPRQGPEEICWRLSSHYHSAPGGHVRIFREKNLRAAIQEHAFIFQRKHWAHGLHSPYWWLKCAFWDRRESLWIIKLYHRLLVWDIMKAPKLLRRFEKLVLNPLMGKSVALYFRKESSH